MNKKQSEIQQFSASLQISEKIGEYFLTKNKMSEYSAKKQYTSLRDAIHDLSILYQQYAFQGAIQDDQKQTFTQFINAIGIADDSFSQLLLTYKCRASKRLRFTLDEFVLGMLKLKCKTIGDLKVKLQQRKAKMIAQKTTQKIYSYFFKVISEGKNTIYFTEAIALWDGLYKSVFPWISDFVAYCESQPNEFKISQKVSLDVWNQVWKFNEVIGQDISQFNEDGNMQLQFLEAWPLLIQDFVDHIKSQRR